MKACDRVIIEILWKSLEKKDFRIVYIKVIMDVYEGAPTSVRTQSGATDNFLITIGLHQGLTLSSYLFTLVLDVLTKHIQ